MSLRLEPREDPKPKVKKRKKKTPSYCKGDNQRIRLEHPKCAAESVIQLAGCAASGWARAKGKEGRASLAARSSRRVDVGLRPRHSIEQLRREEECHSPQNCSEKQGEQERSC